MTEQVSDSTLSKLWTPIALAAIYFSVNGILDIQGSDFLLPLLLEVSSDRSGSTKAIFWFLFSAITYLATLFLANRYIARHAGASALKAWPVMFGLTLPISDPVSRSYQRFWLLTILMLPMWACIFLINEVFELQVYDRGGTQCLAEGLRQHLTTSTTSAPQVAINVEELRRAHESLATLTCANSSELLTKLEPKLRGQILEKLRTEYSLRTQPVIFLLLLLAIGFLWLNVVARLLGRSRFLAKAKLRGRMQSQT